MFAVLGSSSVCAETNIIGARTSVLVPGVFNAGTCLLVVNTIAEKPTESFAGLALILLGLPAYSYWHRRSTH